jgi:hypothetical protein
LKGPFGLSIVVIRLYENIIAKFKSGKGLSKTNCYNIGVKQGCPLSPIDFGISINKLEVFLENISCSGIILTRIVIVVLLYKEDIVLLKRGPYECDKQLKILKDLCVSFGMLINVDNTKVMIIKSSQITYPNFA